MKSKSGFTIIEILVVVTVIAILSGLAIVTYQTIRTESRDAKRKADIEALVSLFEKYYEENGEYPTGCSQEPASNKQQCAYGNTSNPAVVPTSNPNALYLDTSIASLSSVFPAITGGFGDPSNPGSNLFVDFWFGSSNKGYYYRGQLYNIGGVGNISGVVIGSTNAKEATCGPGINIYQAFLSGGPEGTFILGYWSEAQSKWYFYQGKHGSELTSTAWSGPVRGTTVGQCVFVK